MTNDNPLSTIRCCLLGLLVMTWQGATPVAGQGTANLPQAIATNQAAFAIPYTIPLPKNANEEPTEIRLFVSADQGRGWQLADSAKLTAIVENMRGQFVFRAPQDGEYWFAIRTVDRQGNLRGGRNGPELRVQVDSQQPVLQVSAQRGAAGEVAIRYQASDAALLNESLTLAYQIIGQTTWKTVAVERPVTPTAGQPLQGSTSFWPDQAGQELLVRADIRDRAGNQTSTTMRVPTTPGVPGQPIAQPTATNQLATLPNSASPSGNPAITANNDPPPQFPFGDTSRGSNTRWADVAAAPQPTLAPQQPLPASPNGYPTAAPQPSGLVNETPAPRTLPENNAGPSLFGPGLAQNNSSTALQPMPSPTAGRIESRVTSTGPVTAVSSPVEYRLPNGERPRMVNARTFEWEYELEAVGAAGIAKIELWATRDQGQTWYSVGVDPDNRSPVRTTVESEGLYGYRMTVQSAGGSAPRSPQPGDQPEMWIGVDLTKPNARLLQAELGTGAKLGEIAIVWEANDALLATRPISLAYASQANGPWTTIAAGLENTGRYAWRYDAQTPERLFIRLEVRDEAGNVSLSESIQPISLERTQPQIKLRQVRPITDGNPQSRIAEPLPIEREQAVSYQAPIAENLSTEEIAPTSPVTAELPSSSGQNSLLIANPFVPQTGTATLYR